MADIPIAIHPSPPPRLRKTLSFLAVVMLLAATALSAGIQRARYLMGTVCEISASDPSQIDAAFAEAQRIERLISTWDSRSELSQVNEGQATPSPELDALLATARHWSEETGGAFNPAMRGLIDAWGVRDSPRLPSTDEIAAARRNKRIEEGAFGKGYALDRMLAVMDGPAILNFGGQVSVRGSARVTIADPRHRDRPVLAFTLRDRSISTSSGSEKTFNVAGRRFSHLVDPRTGQALPPRGSVSVVHSSAIAADILSTALYVMGADEGMAWARRHHIQAVFIGEDESIRFSFPLPSLEVLDSHFATTGD